MPENITYSIELPDGRTTQWSKDQYDKASEKLYEKYPDAKIVRTSALDDTTEQTEDTYYHVALPDGRQTVWDAQTYNTKGADLTKKYPKAQISVLEDVTSARNRSFAREYEAALDKSAMVGPFREGEEQANEEYLAANANRYMSLKQVYGRQEPQPPYPDVPGEEPVTNYFARLKQNTNRMWGDIVYGAGELIDINSRSYTGPMRVNQDLAKEALSVLEEREKNGEPALRLDELMKQDTKSMSKEEKDAYNHAIDVERYLSLRGAGDNTDSAKQLLTREIYGDKEGRKLKEKGAKIQDENSQEGAGFAAKAADLTYLAGSGVAAIGATMLGHPEIGAAIGDAAFATFAASSAGSAMRQARDAGATDEQTFAAGATSAAIMGLVGRIPFVKALGNAGRVASTEAAEATMKALGNPAVRATLEKETSKLAKEAAEAVGMSASGYMKRFAGQVASSTTTFAAMGGLEAAVPLIYANPDEYPALNQIAKSVASGAVDGAIMGVLFGGVNTGSEYLARRKHINDQYAKHGGVVAAALDFGKGEARVWDAKSRQFVPVESVPQNGWGEILNVQHAPGVEGGAAEWVHVYSNGKYYIVKPSAVVPETVTMFKPEGLAERSRRSFTEQGAEEGRAADTPLLRGGIRQEKEYLERKAAVEERNGGITEATQLDIERNNAALSGRRDAALSELVQRLGNKQFWIARSGPDHSVINTVHSIVYADGKEVFVVSQDSEGNYAVINPDGKPGFLSQNDINNGIADGSIVDESVKPLDDYLDSRVVAQDAADEELRMSEDLSNNIASIIEKVMYDGKINIGTAESENWATVKDYDPSPRGGVVVETDKGDVTLSWQRVADAIGMPLKPMTNEEIAVERIKEETPEAVIPEQEPVEESAEPAAATEEAQPVEDNTPRDFRGNEIPLKDDGEVNETAFWNKDPEAWAKWNDEKRQDGGTNSRGYIAKAKKKLEGDVKGIQKQLDNELDFDRIAQLERQRDGINNRIADLDRIEQDYAAAETASNAEAESPAAAEQVAPAEAQPVQEIGKPQAAEPAGTNISGPAAESVSVSQSANEVSQRIIDILTGKDKTNYSSHFFDKVDYPEEAYDEVVLQWDNFKKGMEEQRKPLQKRVTELVDGIEREERQKIIDAAAQQGKTVGETTLHNATIDRVDARLKNDAEYKNLIQQIDAIDAQISPEAKENFRQNAIGMLKQEFAKQDEVATRKAAGEIPTPEQAEANLSKSFDDINERLKGVNKGSEEYEALMQEKAIALEEYYKAIGTEQPVVGTRSNILQKMVDAGCRPGAILSVEEAFNDGALVEGFSNNGKRFIVADDIRNADRARKAYIHERQHGITKSEGYVPKILAMDGVSEETLLPVVNKMAGFSEGQNGYKGTPLSGLADEVISLSMEVAYDSTPENIEDNLLEAGLDNQEIINFVKTIDDEQRRNGEALNLARRPSHAGGDTAPIERKDGGDFGEVSEGLLGREASRTDEIGESRTGEGGLDTSGDREVETPLSPAQQNAIALIEGEKTEPQIRLENKGLASNQEEVRFSARYSPSKKEEAKIASDISKEVGIPVKKAKDWVKSETSLAAIVLDEANSAYLDYEGDDRYTAIKNDSDYPQGAVDFNNICRKRLAFTDMYQRIQKAFPNTIITGKDLAIIRQIMKDKGLTVACGLCYVEDRRQLLGEIARNFIQEMKGNFENYAKGGETKQKNAEKFRSLLGNDVKEDLSIYDLLTLDGSQKLYKEHPGIYNAFQAFNKARGQQIGNLFQGYAEYKREILKWNRAKVKSVNSNGGLRIFSYSDFEAHHLIDLVQIIQDCARKGVMIQGYTKVPAFARAVANTNIKLNRSLIPQGDTGIVDGKLAYDPVEGIDINDSDFLESNDNIGNILIGINDEQIRLAMADPFIHFIIPYHSNQSGILRTMKQTGAWTNYKNEQVDKGGKEINIYTDVLQAAEKEGKPIKTERQFTEKFLAVCKERGMKPRFWRFLNTNEKGDYVYTPGYYKFLVDFKLFDEQGRILPQKPVKANFDDKFNAKILGDYVADEKEKLGENLDGVYDEIVNALGLEEREPDVRFRKINSIQKHPVSAEASEPVVSDDDVADEVMFRLSKNNRATVESWLKKREDLSDEQRGEVMDYLDGLEDSKTQLATAKWFANGKIRLPEDMPKVEQAISVAGKAKVDPLQYGSPMELLDAHADFKPTEKRINPDEVSTLHRAAEYPDSGIVVYDVDPSQESRENMRKIINTHFGEDASPWCLLQGDGKGNLTAQSARYWKHYGAYRKQVAFKDGKLLAFSANDTHTKLWWDRQDKSHYGIPVTMKVPGDKLGRSADHIIDESGNLIVEPGGQMFRGNQQNGVFEVWSGDGETLRSRTEYKAGKENGITEEWYPSGQIWKRAVMKDDNYAGTYEMWYENGQQKMSVRMNEDGLKDGEQLGWYKNGNKQYEAHYKDGRFVGDRIDYFETGEPKSIIHYDESGDVLGYEDYVIWGGPREEKRVGISRRVTYAEGDSNRRTVEEFWATGKVRKKEEYHGGKLDGIVEFYNADGSIQSRTHFVDGDRHGIKEVWHPNGQLWLRSDFYHGEPQVNGIDELYDDKGNPVYKKEYKDGEVVRDLLAEERDGVRFSKKENLTDAQKKALAMIDGFSSAEGELAKDGVSVDNEELLRRYGLSNLTLTKKGDVVTLNKVVAAEQKKGNGTKFMNALTEEADRNGWTLALTPDDSFGATSVGRLKKFYKRFGFKENKGKNTDFEINESMVRQPDEVLFRKANDETIDIASSLLARYNDQDGEANPWMSEGELLERIEEELPYGARTKDVFAKIDEYRRLDQEDFDEGRRDYSGSERDDVFQEILSGLEKLGEEGVMFRKTYHGSGADFDRFDHSHMGEGEGNQAFGWGTYVSTNEQTGRAYAERFGSEGNHHLYSVSIPEDNGENYIHWDKPITSRQSQKIMDAVRKLADKEAFGDEFENELKSGLGYGTYGRYVEGSLNYFLGNEMDYATGKDPGAERNAKLLNSVGIVGIEIPVDRNGGQRYEGSNFVIFDEKNLDITDHVRFRKANQSQNGFISNAEASLDRIKMDKATPEQWLKMIEKEGGLKAGEDKWLGLSDWLKGQDKKSISKEDIANFIAENRIQIEEVHYSENARFKDQPFYADRYDATESDDVRPANDTRLTYTTEGLENKREIALTVPTIDPWQESDKIHFGDAGEGRAVAWIRFGDALTERGAGDAPLEVRYKGAEPVDEPHRRAIEGILLNWNDNESVMRNERRENQFGAAKSMFENALRDNYYEGTDEQRTLRAQTMAVLDEINESDFEPVYEGGQRVLVIDEIQSNRHQQGREKGYTDENTSLVKEARDRAAKEWEDYSKELRDKYKLKDDITYVLMQKIYNKATPEEFRKAAKLNQAVNAAQEEWRKVRDNVPAAPFEKNWHELAMKRMLRLAAEEGYDKIAWTTGDQQADRYNLGGVVNKIESAPYKSEGYNVDIVLNNGEVLLFNADKEGAILSDNSREDQYTGKNLSDVVGKDIAKRILDSTEEQTISGDGLRVGGEGMRGFYDDILPRFMNKYGKKWGVKVQDIDLPGIGESGTGLTMHSVDVTPEMKESVMEGQVMFRKAEAKTEDGDVIKYESTGGLPEGSERTSLVERTYKKSGAFSFTGKEKVESAADVAYIFKALETEANENSFIVFVKDGKPTILHTGMGTISKTSIDLAPMVAGMKDFAPDEVYMVHNHPSGRVEASQADLKELERLQKMAGDIPVQGVIIDTVTGEYGMFDAEMGGTLVLTDERKHEESENVPLEVQSFDKMVFSPEYKAEIRGQKMTSPQAVAAYISAHRLGEGSKLGALLVDRKGMVTGNLVFNGNYITKDNAGDFAQDAVDAAVRSAAEQVILFGDFDYSRGPLSDFRKKLDELSGGTIKLTDVVKVDGNHTRSLTEGTLMDSAEEEMSSKGRTIKPIESQEQLSQRANDILHLTPIHISESTKDDKELKKDYMSNAPLEKDGLTIHFYGGGFKKSVVQPLFRHIVENVRQILDESVLAYTEYQDEHLIGKTRPDNSTHKGRRNILEFRNYVNKIELDGNEYFVRFMVFAGKGDATSTHYHRVSNIEFYKENQPEVRRPVLTERLGSLRVDNDTNLEQFFELAKKSSEGLEDFASEYGDSEVRFRKVTDQEALDRLNSEPTIKVYRSMQEIDGKYYPPMAAKVDGEWQNPSNLGTWEESEERPDMVDDNGQFKLDKGNGKSLKAAYAPYFHSRLSPLNEQFSEAYNRDNLVIVEGEVPESELTSGYTAEKSKKSTGEHDWPSGRVSNALAKRGEDTRKVILSRWFKPVREVPASEVADIIAAKLKGSDITFPYNVVTPALRGELAKRGVQFKGWQGNKPENWEQIVSEMKRQNRMAKEVEKARTKGIAGVIGEEDTKDFYMDVYRAVSPEIRERIAARAERNGWNMREAVSSYLSELASKPISEDETGTLRVAAGILSGYAEGIDEKTAQYILFRGEKSGDDDIIDTARDIAKRKMIGVGEFYEPVMFRLSDDIEGNRAMAGAIADDAKEMLESEKSEARKDKLFTTVKAMSLQKQYDSKTVNAITSVAKSLLKEQGINALTRHEIARLLGMVSTSVGRTPAVVKRNADALVNMIIDHLIKEEKSSLDKLMKVKASKVNSSGVEVIGALDVRGQNTVKAFKAGMDMQLENPNDEYDETTIAGRLAALEEKMTSSDDAVRAEAEDEYAGLTLAKEYQENIRNSENEERGIKNEMQDAAQALRDGDMSRTAYRQFVKEAENSIRENQIERIEAYRDLRAKMLDMMSGSAEARKEFQEREKERVEEIHHNANSDMQGEDASPFRKPTALGNLANSSLVRFFLSPLATFDQMLRFFGKKSINGEGYLWNRYMRGWTEATENAFTGQKQAKEELDAKVSEVFDKKMRWSDLYAEERKMPAVKVKWWDGGKMADHELTQGNLLYIYMVNKMSDGRMKLRRMGIDEDLVEAIKGKLDPRFIELADWLQDEYLVDKRNKYNAVHERLFGASMAAIENYFPLKINKRSLNKAEDIGRPEFDDALPATTTGSIIKRRRNAQDLDLLNADAFSVVIEHVEQMEQWAAFAELNKDINTLLSYKRFRNQVMNMTSVYGSGTKLWNTFKNVARIAGGTYHPSVKAESLDTAAMNIAKGVTAAKISFRVYTALKQFLSMPAFLSDASPRYLAENLATPWKAWNWAMENLPVFEKRWKSRIAGDTRLMNTDSDWKFFRSNIYDTMSKWGMSPNAFVDALTVSIGSHSMYQTRYERYIKEGYPEEKADKMAKQDATVLYNETQQSSEGAFVSPVQLDRTVMSSMITVFRNSAMGYQRQLHDAIRNLGKMMKSGYKQESIEFMAKQMVRDGLTEEQAQHAAERRYGRAFWHNAVRVATFGFIVQFAWNLGGSLAYLLFGDDDDEKKGMLEEAAVHALVGGPVEGLAGGNIASEAFNMLAKGESLRGYDPTLLPIIADAKRTMQMMGYDQVAGANELVNLAVQAGLGVNPQTLTDSVVAVIDACGGDLETSKEAMLLIMRVLQVPQSQVDKIYIDELGVKASTAKRMSYSQMARRYAEYKVMKGAPLTGWAYSDKAEEKREQAYLKRFKTMVNERKKKK